MRILHTADWHVGRTLRGRSRAAEHRAVLAEIAGLARERNVDLVLVAGDLFDGSAPGPESEEIVYRALLDLAATGASIVIVAGNHDNPRRLTAVRPLLALTRVHVLGEVARPDAGGVLELELKPGERARIALLPFLSQRGIVRAAELMAGEPDEHAQAYAARAERVIGALCAELPGDTVNILVGHAMVHGGVLGGGERSAHTVFDYSIPATAFPAGLHYAALGHLHRAQELAGGCPIRYSGAPLALDFAEAQDTKSVVLVEARPGQPVVTEAVPLAAGRRLRRVRGTLEELERRAAELAGDWISVEVDHDPEPGLSDRVRAILPDAVDVRLVERERTRTTTEPPRTGLSPQELFAAYLAERKADTPELLALFAELLEELPAAEATEAEVG